jgi:F-box/leucine-rich repeat protein 2/20
MKNVFRSLQETVVQNLSRRCGGFLKRLGLKGCKSVGDGALRYDLCTACFHICA